MGNYPKPDGYVGSANDGDLEVILQGTGGRLAYDPNAEFQTTDDRRYNHIGNLGSE